MASPERLSAVASSVSRRTHYEVLGVAPASSVDEIRRAYRTRIKQAHPDARGGRDDGESSAITEAWRVLSDPGRRLDYDRELRGTSSPEPSTSSAPPARSTVPYQPARFPWRLVLGLIVVGALVVLVLNASAAGGDPTRPDGLIGAGSCIVVDETIAAVEVTCEGPHEGVVRVLVGFDMSCPSDTEAVRDRQGMGLACVRFVADPRTREP